MYALADLAHTTPYAILVVENVREELLDVEGCVGVLLVVASTRINRNEFNLVGLGLRTLRLLGLRCVDIYYVVNVCVGEKLSELAKECI